MRKARQVLGGPEAGIFFAISNVQQKKIGGFDFGFERSDTIGIETAENQFRFDQTEELADVRIVLLWRGSVDLEEVEAQDGFEVLAVLGSTEGSSPNDFVSRPSFCRHVWQKAFFGHARQTAGSPCPDVDVEEFEGEFDANTAYLVLGRASLVSEPELTVFCQLIRSQPLQKAERGNIFDAGVFLSKTELVKFVEATRSVS